MWTQQRLLKGKDQRGVREEDACRPSVSAGAESHGIGSSSIRKGRNSEGAHIDVTSWRVILLRIWTRKGDSGERAAQRGEGRIPCQIRPVYLGLVKRLSQVEGPVEGPHERRVTRAQKKKLLPCNGAGYSETLRDVEVVVGQQGETVSRRKKATGRGSFFPFGIKPKRGNLLEVRDANRLGKGGIVNPKKGYSYHWARK